MPIHKIITAENPILRQKAKKIHHFDPSIQKLANEMFETMHAARGVGLAAPQIAQSIRLFVAEFEDHKVAMVNPEIVKAEGEELGAEGWFARVLQHEIDHLDGILFLDRLERPEDLHEISEEEQFGEEAEAAV